MNEMTLAQKELSSYNDELSVFALDEMGKEHKMAIWAVIENFLKIRTKKGRLVPFVLKRAQVDFYKTICENKRNGKPLLFDILKARQLGFSTLIAAIIFVLCAFQMDKSAAIIAEKRDTAHNIFLIYQTFYESLPDALKRYIPNRSNNANELSFDFGNGHISRIDVLSQGDAAGRSFSVQYAHLSECSRYDNLDDTLGSITPSADSDSIIFLETTANGYNDYKYVWDLDCLGDTGYTAVFVPWFKDPSYSTPYNGHKMMAFEQDLIDNFKVSLDQVQWYRDMYDKLRHNLQKMKQEFPSTADESFISTGNCFFDLEAINKRKAEASKLAVRKGFFTYSLSSHFIADREHIELKDIKWVDDEDGPITVGQSPKDGFPYCIGADPADLGCDGYACDVMDNTNKQSVATFYGNGVDSDKFAFQLYCLGKTYNWALLASEVNKNRAVMLTLKKTDYPNLYIREGDITNAYESMEALLGVLTTQINKPVMLELYQEAFRDDPHTVFDMRMLVQMASFSVIKKESTDHVSYGAASKKDHDDLVMARAINLLISQQQRCTVNRDISKKNSVIAWANDELSRSNHDIGRELWKSESIR